MPGLSDRTTGLTAGTGTGLVWLIGGLGTPGVVIPASTVILDRPTEGEILDRSGAPIQSRV